MRHQITAILIVTLAFCVMQGDSFSLKHLFSHKGCKSNDNCATNMVCEKKKCKDPCMDLCGMNTNCTVMNHSPTCACMPSYMGDPYSGCYQQMTSAQKTQPSLEGPSDGEQPLGDEDQDDQSEDENNEETQQDDPKQDPTGEEQPEEDKASDESSNEDKPVDEQPEGTNSEGDNMDKQDSEEDDMANQELDEGNTGKQESEEGEPDGTDSSDEN